MLNLEPLEWTKYTNRIDRTTILYSRIWGSHSHNTHLPESDIDYLGVYVAPNEALLGLRKPPDTVTGEKPDFQVHEVGKFCDLLLKGNPGIVEMLFTDRMCYRDPKWTPLFEKRKDFLSQRAVKQYLGYAQAQIKRLEAGQSVHSKGGKVGEKWAYHMYRLAVDAKRIAEFHEPVVWKEGSERDLLMKIRTGEISAEEVVRMTKGVISEIDALTAWRTDLPEEGSEAFLEKWLLWVRGMRESL
jgi:uncharacterized protein